MMSEEKLEEFFASLPDEKQRGYEKSIAKLAEKCSSQEDIDLLHTIIDKQGGHAYEAFVCLTTIYRRNKDFEMLKKAIDDHPEFKKRISYNHILIQYWVHSESFYDYDQLLLLAYRDAQTFSDNAGYLQAFCNAFATICERCSDEDREKIVKDWYDEAYACINRAIELDPAYAKFYCTKGRILALREKFSEAIDLINLSVSKENSNRPDYALTIMNYQIHRLSIQMRWQKTEYEAQLRRQEKILNRLIEHLDGAALPKTFDEGAGDIQFLVSAYQGDQTYAFLSYAHKDQSEVYEIISKLQRSHIRIWFDKGLKIGGEWPEEIADRLIRSSVVLIMLSANSIQSANVRREVNLALSENKSIIVVRLDDVGLSPGMKLQFGLYQMVLKNQYDDQSFIRLLASSIQNKLEYD